MARTCVTHHYACDCREEYVRKLEACLRKNAHLLRGSELFDSLDLPPDWSDAKEAVSIVRRAALAPDETEERHSDLRDNGCKPARESEGKHPQHCYCTKCLTLEPEP